MNFQSQSMGDGFAFFAGLILWRSSVFLLRIDNKNDKYNVKLTAFVWFLAKNIRMGLHISIDHFFADQFRSDS